jgi:VWFA-related protein
LPVAPIFAQTARFTTGVEAVRVDTLVTDGRRPVVGLKAGDFELRDNGVLQTVRDVSYESLPLNIICVLDTSGSVAGQPLAHLKDAMTAVIDALGADDRAALVTFASRLHLQSTLTRDRADLRRRLSELTAGGDTAVLDATFAGLALRESDDGRTLLILFSDGRDTASWLTVRKVLDVARNTDVVIYPVTVRHVPVVIVRTLQGTPVPAEALSSRRFVVRNEVGDRLLRAFADDTGGRVVVADDEGGVRGGFVKVLSEFRQRYVLAYTPSGVAPDGWHTLDVRLKNRKGDVKARRGYVAKPVTPDEASRTRSR